MADLQHLAATASGYYPDHHSISGASNVYPSYGASTNPSAYHGPSGQYSTNYMTTLYPVNNASMSEYEVRKKATFDALVQLRDRAEVAAIRGKQVQEL